MKNILDIAKIVGCTDDNAMKVFMQMSADGVDFSRVSKRGFRDAALDAAARIFGAAVLAKV